MRLKPPAVFFVLLALFLAAMATRTTTRDKRDTPYFEGESAMTYGHALLASDGVPLDTVSVKANHPLGYTPARYRADGFETAWALGFRAARFVSEVDGRDFARGITVLLAALCVFTMYAATRQLWDCQASGLLAAFLVAFLLPFVAATNGRVFTHAALAPLFVSAHAALFWKTLASRSPRAALLTSLATAVTAFVLAVSWEPALGWLAAWSALSPDESVSTVDLRVDYLEPAGLDGVLRAEAELVRKGNRVCHVRIALTQQEVLVAEGRGVYNIHRRAEAKP